MAAGYVFWDLYDLYDLYDLCDPYDLWGPPRAGPYLEQRRFRFGNDTLMT